MDAIIDHIEIVGDVPYIKGRHIKIKMVAQMYLAESITIEDVIEQYGLSLAQIHAAMAYYYDHKDYFNQKAQEIQPLIEKVKRESQERRERLRAQMNNLQDEE